MATQFLKQIRTLYIKKKHFLRSKLTGYQLILLQATVRIRYRKSRTQQGIISHHFIYQEQFSDDGNLVIDEDQNGKPKRPRTILTTEQRLVLYD